MRYEQNHPKVHADTESSTLANEKAKYHYELLTSAKNDAKSKFFQTLKTIDKLTTTLNNTLSNEHMNIVKNVTDKSETKTFHE